MASVHRKGQEVRNLAHNNDNCVGCGICSDICPTSALSLNPILPISRGILDMDYIKINDDTCVLCGLCSFACPFHALEFDIGNEDMENNKKYPKWNHGTITNDNCIYCGKCEIYCPRDAIFVNRELPKLKDLVVGEMKNDVEKCITCHICEEMCPSGAISIKTEHKTKEDIFNATDIEVDPEKCMYCKICQKVCPENAINMFCTSCMDSDQIDDVKINGEILLNSSTCVNCSWCEHICPSDAIHTKKPFTGELIIQENEEEGKVCKGESCHACQDVCPCNALKLSDNKMKVKPGVCVLCGACEKACPQKILSVKRDSMELTNIKSKSWERILGSLIE